jgi:hypothetical protein
MFPRTATFTALAISALAFAPQVAFGQDGSMAGVAADRYTGRMLMNGDASPFSADIDAALLDGATIALRSSGAVVPRVRSRIETVDRAAIYLTMNDDEQLMVGAVFDGSRETDLYVETMVGNVTTSYALHDAGSVFLVDADSAPDTIRFSADEIHLGWDDAAELSTRGDKARLLINQLVISRAGEDKEAESTWQSMVRPGIDFCEGNSLAIVSEEATRRGFRAEGDSSPVTTRAAFECTSYNNRRRLAMTGAAWLNFDIDAEGQPTSAMAETILEAAYGSFNRYRTAYGDKVSVEGLLGR